MQRMIRQFAAEYTSKTSSTQDSNSPNSTKNQSLLKASPVASSSAGATAQNPVLSKLLMADQDSPLDLTVKKSQLDPSEQDGVLDLSTKKSPCAGSASLSHSPGCSTAPGNGEDTAEAKAINCLGQPKSPLEKFMVRLCTYHQKHFVRVLNDICSEVQTGCSGQQLPGPENMDVSACSSSCSQYRTENQELGISESKLPSCLDPEQSGPHGSLRLLCHALKQAVDLKSTDKRENCSPIVRRDFPELPNIRTSSANPRDSPTQGYLTASNCHHSVKALEGQISGSEQETGIRKSEEDKEQAQSRPLLGGYIAVKASHVNTSEDSLECRGSLQKNPFKVFPEETREAAFTTSSPRRADKENSFQCSSKSLLHQDPELNDQEMKQKAENHHQALGKCKGSYHVHPVDKTHVENAKDSWLPTTPMPVVHHKTANGHTRAKNISTSSKSTRKSKRSSGLRINDYDNQCDVVYISQPITECHFESKRAVSSRKTARKSTRGYYYNGECCELPTVRTLAKISLVQESGNILAPQLEVVTSPSQGVTLPGGSCLATVHAESSTGEKRAFIVDHPQEDSLSKKSQGTAEQSLAEIIPPQASFLEQSDVSSVEAFTNDLSLLLCPVSHAKEGSLSVSSVQATVPSPALQQNEGERQDMANTNGMLQADNDKDSCKNSELNEDGSSAANSVLLSVPEAANTEVNSVCLENESDSKPTVLIDPEPPVCRDVLPSKEPEARMDLLPPLEEPASVVDLAASVDPPPLSPINPVQPQAELPALVCLDPSVAFPVELPSVPEYVHSGKPVATSRAVSPVVVPVSVVPEPPVLEPSEALSVGAAAAEPSKEDSELPQLPPKIDTAELPVSLQCANAYGNTDAETDVDSSHGLQDSMTGKHETVLPIADTDDNQGGGNVTETREKSKAGEGEEIDSSTPSVLRIPEASHRVDVSSKMYRDKKRKREKKPQVASDRCLRSQQSLLPAEDSTEEPSSSTSVQLPQLQIKLSKSPGAKRFKREVHLDGAVSVCVPSDRFHETQLNHTGNTPEQPVGEGNDITMGQTYKKLVATEAAIEESQDGEGNNSKPGAMLEICLEASSDKRSVHVPEEASDKDERQTDPSSGAPEDTDRAMNVTEVPCTLYEASCPPSPGSKNESREGPLERSVKYKKPALQFYNLRHSPVPASVATAYKSTSGKEIMQGHSHVIDPQSTGNEGHLGFSSMEVLSDKPKFVEWCAEEENQELIANFDAQYMKIQKGWIQLEKEVQPAPKVKNKSDKLKEIWKSKKRTRKFKGSTEVQKLSPVQMLFMKPFDMSDICKWFMETTETKSLVIVKKLNTRLPGDLPPTKLPLQKGCSSGAYPSSLQAERLKKHLKKFAALTPAKNTIRTQKLWAKLRESPEETELEQAGSQQQASPSEGSMEHGIEAKNAQPPPSIPVQTSSRILRKYSNLRGKLHGLRRMVKQEKNDCVVKHSSLESKPSNKSLCSKSPVPAKLAQAVRAVALPTKSRLVGKGGKGKKGKDGPQEDISSKGNLQQSRKKTPNESSSRLQGQQSSSSKEKVPLKKASKTKHVETAATKKQIAVERSNKHASQSEKAKKLANSQLGKRKSTTAAAQKGKASTNQKSTLPSRPEGSAKPLKQKAVQDLSSRSLKATQKKATSSKALTRSGKRIQDSKKGQGKKRLRAKEDASPIKRRRLDTK